MSSDSVRLELELKCYEVSGKRALGAWTGCCWESYGLSSFRFPIAALRHLETCFLPVPWEDRAVFFWQLCHSMHSDVCEFWGLMCKEIGAPQVSLWTPRWQKNNAHYRKPGVSCKCKTLHLQQPRPVPYCRVRQTKRHGWGFPLECTHWLVYISLFDPLFLIREVQRHRGWVDWSSLPP